MEKNIKNYLKKVDLLAVPYDFNVCHNEQSSTITGGVLSLLVILFTVVYTANYFIRISSQSASIYSGTDAQDLETIQLNQQNIAFALELTKTKGEIISYMEGLDQYFKIEASLVEQYRVQGVYGYKRVYTQLTPSRCSKTYIEQFNFKSISFTQQQLDNFICFEGSFYLDGQFYDPKFTYIKLEIVKCAGDNCKSEKEIYDFLDGGVDVDLFIKDTNIKTKYDPSNPAEIFPTNIFWRLSTSVGNNEDIFMSPVSIDQISNKDIPFDDATIDTRLYTSSKVTKSERRQMSFDLQTVTSMCTFYLRTANGSDNYFVNDTSTLALVLSSISEGTGLALAIISALQVYCKIFGEHRTIEIIMNHVFKFNLNDKKDEDNYQIQDYNTKRIADQFGQKINYNIFGSALLYIKYFINGIKCFPKCKIKNETILAEYAKRKIQKDLNLSSIVKKLYEIDFIKSCLFDNNQLILFNTFSQPIFERKMVEESINQKNDINYLIESSEIPIEDKLVKFSPFFYTQISKKTGPELNDLIGKNRNEKFLNRLKEYNQYLNNFLEKNNAQVAISPDQQFQRQQAASTLEKNWDQINIDLNQNKVDRLQKLEISGLLNNDQKSAQE